MTADILKRLRQSIREKRCAVLRCAGHQHVRVVEPHVIYTDKDGTVVLGCFQVRGPGNAGVNAVTWQLLQLRQIESVFLLDIAFAVRTDRGFDPGSPEFQRSLIAIVTGASAPAAAAHGSRSPAMLWYQARGWLWDVGSVIDRVLSDRGQDRRSR